MLDMHTLALGVGQRSKIRRCEQDNDDDQIDGCCVDASRPFGSPTLSRPLSAFLLSFHLLGGESSQV